MRGLVLIGLIVLIFMVMPNAIAKFSLQHKFVNKTEVDCAKCHPAEVSEFTSDPSMPHAGTLDCKDCHLGPNWESGETWYEASQIEQVFYNSNQETLVLHGAALVECLWCHGDMQYTFWGGANITAEFENSTIEAHRPLYFRAKNASGLDTNDILAGANEACIACHTHATNVTVAHAEKYLNVTAYYTGTGAYDGWNISFSVNQ